MELRSRRLGALFACLLAFAAVLVIFEEKLIYFPSSDLDVTPAVMGLPHEEVFLVTTDGKRIHAWYLPVREGGGYTVLVCHGNAGNISGRLERAVRIQRELSAGVLLFDYRGFGRSEGSPDEEGTYRDALAAYGYLTGERGIDPNRILLFGESLGAAVAIELALRVPVGAVVVEAPFASIRAMARVAYPFLPTGWVRTKYDNVAKVGELDAPILIFHGTRDDTVPYAQGEELFRAAREPKDFVAIEGGGHTDGYVVGGERYWNAWRKLLDALPPRDEMASQEISR